MIQERTEGGAIRSVAIFETSFTLQAGLNPLHVSRSGFSFTGGFSKRGCLSGLSLPSSSLIYERYNLLNMHHRDVGKEHSCPQHMNHYEQIEDLLDAMVFGDELVVVGGLGSGLAGGQCSSIIKCRCGPTGIAAPT